MCGGLATGLEAFLKAGYAVASYTWVDTNPVAYAAVSHRLSRLRIQYPHLFPPEATQCLDTRLPVDTRAISPEVFTTDISKGLDIISTSPPMMTQHLPRVYRGTTLPD